MSRPTLLLTLLPLLALPLTADDAPPPRNVVPRSEFLNSRLRFERDGEGHVAFLGGSITEMEGYRPRLAKYLEERFPETRFTFTNAGIASTCSTTGAFRLETDILERGPVDLLLVEFAVNDDQDAAHDEAACVRGLEGILRRARRHHPEMDIVVTHFVNPGMLEIARKGKEPLSVGAHERVARAYGVSTVRLAHEVADRIREGSLTWKEFGGTHPGPAGNDLAAGMVSALLDRSYRGPLPEEARARPHPLPEPLDPESYFRGRFLALTDALMTEGWKLETPAWKDLPGNCRSRFAREKLLVTARPGERLELSFSGRAVGIYLLAGPDAGRLRATIDGRPAGVHELYHRFSGGLHYPRSVIFAHDLEDGPHVLTLEVVPERHEKSRGNAVRILHFLAN